MLASSTYSIEELTIPPSIDDPSAGEFVEMVSVRNAIESEALGGDSLACTPEELLPVYRSQQFEPKRIFVAKVAGRMVGRAVLAWSIADGSRSSWVSAEVLGDCRHRGIGSALFDLVEALAIESGRTVLQSEILHTCAPGGERLNSPTGIGDLPMADPGVQFLLRRDYRLEQTERYSLLDLPLDRATLEQAYRTALLASGKHYRVCSWSGSTPQERIDDLITLRTRMSTDAPSAGLDVDEESWTAARLAHADAAVVQGGRPD